MSKVLAKFRLTQLQDATYAPAGSAHLTLMAVEGEPFGSATPNGYIQMTIHNPAAVKPFKDAYQAYLDAIEVFKTLPAEERAKGVPKQPEFYVSFKFDDGKGSE